MKLVIEIDQPEETRPPVVTLLVDGQPIGMIQRLEFILRASDALPKASIRLPSIDALALSQDMKTTVQGLQTSIAKCKKQLKFFKSWLEVL